jgi:FkbM family methyltransferase
MLRSLRRAVAAVRARTPQEPGTANTGLRRRLWRLGWDVHRFDPDLTIEAFVTTVLTTHRVNCVIDVGARIGDYGRWLRQIGYRGQIISFEPVAEHVRALTEVAARDGRWTVLPFGLGSVSEARTISVTKSSDFTSLLTPRADATALFPGAAVDHEETVEIRRLDELFSTIMAGIPNPRVYLKLDTQGSDVEVLRGAAGCLEHVLAGQTELSFVPLYEGQPSYLEALAELDRHQLAPAGFFVEARTSDWRLIEANCIIVRRPG